MMSALKRCLLLIISLGSMLLCAFIVSSTDAVIHLGRFSVSSEHGRFAISHRDAYLINIPSFLAIVMTIAAIVMPLASLVRLGRSIPLSSPTPSVRSAMVHAATWLLVCASCVYMSYATVRDRILWCVALVISTAIATYYFMLVRAARRQVTRRIAGLCAHCGYDLRHSPDKCPECGIWTAHNKAPK
jgi:hypothetical protein